MMAEILKEWSVLKESQMKTCETCKGTGQVAEPINVSDLVSINVRMTGWTGVGVITRIGPIYVDVLMVSGPHKGETGGWSASNLTVLHGHIHIDR